MERKKNAQGNIYFTNKSKERIKKWKLLWREVGEREIFKVQWMDKLPGSLPIRYFFNCFKIKYTDEVKKKKKSEKYTTD